MSDNKRKLYNALSNEYDMGTFEQFASDINDDAKRKKLYDAVSKEYDLGTFDAFSKQLFQDSAPQKPTGEELVLASQQMPSAPAAPYSAMPGDYTQKSEAQKNFEQRGDFAPIGQGSVKLGEREVPAFIGENGQFRVPSPVQLDDQEEVYRHGNPSEAEKKEIEVKQKSDITREVGRLGRDVADRLNAKMDQYRKDFSMPLGGVSGGMVGIPQYELSAEADPEVRALKAAANLVKDSKHQIEKFRRSEDGFIVNTMRSMADTALDLRTWDLGLTDAKDSAELLRVVKKDEKGEKLTENEQLLLDASVNNALIQAYYKAQSAGEFAGATTIEMIPFMAQILLNPLSGVGEAAGSAAAKGVAKLIEKKIIKKGLLGSALKKVAAFGAGAVGDMAGGVGMAVTSNLGNTIADANKREIQGEAKGDAWRKAILGQGIEFASENTGRFFAPFFGGIGKVLGKSAAWGLEKLGAKKVVNLAKDIAGKAYSPKMKEFMDGTQWHGFFGEFGEEIAGGLMNAAMVGDQTVEQVFSKDNLFDTAVGLSVASVLFPAVATVNYAGVKIGQRDKALLAEVEAKKVFGDIWPQFRAAIVNAKDSDEAGNAIKNVFEAEGKKYSTAEETKALYDYASAYYAYNALNGIDPEAVNYRNDDYKALESNIAAGELMDDEQVKEASLEANRLADGLMRVTGISEEELFDMNEDDVFARADEAEENGDFEIAKMWRDYVNVQSNLFGADNAAEKSMQEQQEASDAEVDGITNSNGFIVPATLRGGESVYIVGGNVALNNDGTINDEASDKQITVLLNGEKKIIGITSLGTVEAGMNAEEEKQKRRALIEEEANEKQRVRRGEVHVFTPGETFSTPQGEVQFVSDNGDGTANVTVNGAAQVVEMNTLNDYYRAAEQTAYNEKKNAENAQKTAGAAKQQTSDEATALERVPKNEDGDPIYEQADSDTAWDAIVEQSEGDEAIAQGAVDGMVADKEVELKKLEKSKAKGGATIAEKIAAEKERMANIEKLKADIAKWKEIAGTAARRKAEAVSKMENTTDIAPEGVTATESVPAVEEVKPANEMQPAEELIGESAEKVEGSAAESDISEDNIMLSEEEAENVIAQMKYTAEPARELELTPEAWEEEFGEEGVMESPIGAVKMGENQYFKLLKKKRAGYFGMIKPTLTNPDVVLEEYDPKDGAERQTKYLFVKTFVKADGSRYVHFESVTVLKETLEVSISSHEVNEDALKRKMQQCKLLHLNSKFLNSEGRLIEPLEEGSDLVPTPNSVSSEGEVTTKSDNSNETEQKSDEIADLESGLGKDSQVVSQVEGLQPITAPAEVTDFETADKFVAGLLGGIKITPESFRKETGLTTSEQSKLVGIIAKEDKGGVSVERASEIIAENYGEELAARGFHGDQQDIRDMLIDILSSGHPKSYIKQSKERRAAQWVEQATAEEDAWAQEFGFASYDDMLAYENQLLQDVKERFKDFDEQTYYNILAENNEEYDTTRESERVGTGSEVLQGEQSVSTPRTADSGERNERAEVRHDVQSSDKNADAQQQEEVDRASSSEIPNNQNRDSVSQVEENAPYTIAPAQYTTKKGKVLDMHLVKFNGELTKEQQRAAKELARADKGWYDREQGGFMMRSEESAKQLADTILGNEEAVSEAQPVSMTDIQALNNGDVLFTEPQQVEQTDIEEKSPVWQYSIHVDKETGRTTLRRDDVSGVYPIGDARWQHTAASPEEMLDILRNPLNGMQDVLEAVGVTLENKIKTRELDRKSKEQSPTAETNPSGNRLVTDERYAELRERMRKKLGGQMNIGIDPEILAIGTEMAVYHLEKGARKFTEFAKAMVADLGDVIRPYLKAFYNGARNLPEVESSEIATDMTSYDEVQTFDIANFDKPGIDAIATAETVTREAEVAQEVEVAQERIKKTRSAKKETKKKTVTSQQSSEMGLFDGLFDNETNNDNGLQRTDAERSEGVSANGNRHEQGLSRGTETSSESEQQDSRGTDLGGERTGDAVDRTVRPRLSDTVEDKGIEGKRKKDVENNRKLADELKGVTLFVPDTFGVEHELSGFTYYELENVFHFTDNINGQRNATRKELDAILKIARKNNGKEEISEPKNTRNNHSERGKDHAPTSVDARIEANIKAIELAKQLLESGEQATEKQMQTLRKFSGWGGLGKAFSEGTYYAPNLIAKRLRELLGEAAYQEAVMSANSAYYTPAYVVDTLWDIAEQMGFKGGNILEGSAGIGNILGQMPTHISERSNIHAIEIDGTSGGILSLLYPDAKVEIQGFEETRIANGSVDLAITNVPFVTGLRVNDTTGDKDLSKKFHNIHDFCIAKNVRKLREGGLGIFITSNGTLDNSKKLRDWIVNEGGADFVGAFRMHNKTFGGTGVTSDIIVIRKRVNGKKSANTIDVSTVTGERMAEYDTGETRKVKGQIVPVVKQLSMDYNQYFVEHPENMAGEMHFAFEKGDTFRPTSKGLYPKQEKKQEQMLAEFVQSFTAEEFGEKATDEIEVIDAMPGKKIGEVFVSDGKLYINAIGAAQPLEVNANKVKGHTKVECFEAYSAIKEALAAVLEYQITHEDDKGLKPLLAKLNKAYDDFVATYGHFNKNTAIAFLRNDVDYANVFALEKFEESADAKGNKVQKFGKTDVFSKRVIEKEAEPMPTNVKDGIVASIFKFGRVDIPYIAEQLGKSEAEVKAEIIESGYGFEDPATRQVEVSYQYLSGNVREKLRQAQENNENGEFDRNIKALQEVMPMTIPAHLIDFTLGSSWIEPKLYEEYVKERTDVGVQFTAVGGTWFMNEPYYTAYEKNRAMGVTSEMLGRTVMGHTLIEAAIQNKSITVSTVKKNWDGSTETITDKEATQACSAKIDEIRQDFKEWARQKMQSDAEMSERMERVYNDTFNNYVPMSIPDEFVPEYFGGASHKFKMRSHQGRAIVRGTMQPLLLAHEVGTGKTFTLISTAMEMRRLGTARKPMIVVQNATVGQFVASAKELYPNAKILTLEEADRSADGRKNFYAKIKYNDWDMIVVPQSTFEFIPDSEERQMAFVQEKIEEKMLVLEQMKEADPDGKSMITRQAEREIALLEEELAGLSGETGKKRTANDEKKRAVALQNAEVKAMEMLDRRTDDVENFDDMGIDALLIDEAHEYKHLGFATAMQRGVKGVDPSYSKKSQGVFLKTQAVLEKNNGRNVIFATGTPISNTAAEIWTFMRYLMPADTMKEYGIYYFDDFVRNFGNIQQMLEFTTSGKFKENNRFAGYVNLPELVRIWSGVSDTVLTKEAGGVSDKIPDMEGGKAQDLYLPQTRALRSIMKYVKAELERYDKMSGKEKKENSHIPLTMYGIAKAAAVDARLVQSDAEDDAQSKTNEAVRQTLRSLKESADYKGTVAIFADNYQNKESGFNLYEDIRTKLIAEGVPADEIVVIKSGMTVKKKLEIFEKVNRGEVRVILGSTFTLGTGVNIQERLYTLIHLDAPNRPMDYTQRNGRILRQGNLHKAMGKPVRVLRFGVDDSLDVTAYQRLKTKGAIADSIMNGKQMMANSMTNRVLEEEEDVFGDTVAQLSGSEYAMLKNNAEKNVRKYASRKKQWEADQTYIHNAKPRVKAFIKDAEKRIEDNSRYLEAVRSSFPDGKFKEIVIGKHRFATIEAMEDFFKEHNKSLLAEMKQMKDGDIAGEQKRQLTIQIGDFSFVVTTKLTRQTVRDGATLFNDVERKMTYSCAELGIEDIPVRQNLLRNAIEDITNNVITGRDFAERVEIAERVKKHNETELEQLLSREGKPFEYEAELEQAQTQYEEFSELMKKELAEKEAKYAEMDATVEAANDLATAEEADELEREGDGAYTDDEVSFENDPISKVLGKARGTNKQRGMFAERVRERMREAVDDVASALNTPIKVLESTEGLTGRRAKAKGWYEKSTGRIVVVLPNNKSVADVMQTVLHEAVAHYGLRKLFGVHFDDFIDNIYNNVDAETRAKINRLASRNGWNLKVATEEYLASLAEDANFERVNPSLWKRIKSFFLDMLAKAGVRLDFELTDDELRYILWRSYQNLKNPDRYRTIAEEARDIAMQSRLKVGNYAENGTAGVNVAEDDTLFRSDSELAIDEYNRRVLKSSYQAQEALQDSMLSLKEAQEAVVKETGKAMRDEENAYMAENALSSVNTAEAAEYKRVYYQPLVDAVANVAKKMGYEQTYNYLMAKHGIERNREMSVKEALKKNGTVDKAKYDSWKAERNKTRTDAKKNGLSWEETQKQLDALAKTYGVVIRDYSGLSSLYGDNFTVEAYKVVKDFEGSVDTRELNAAIKAATKATLTKLYNSSLIDEETYSNINAMYDYYIPLRGFDEKTADEVYAYLSQETGRMGSVMKIAKGRNSKADNPIAFIGQMAEQAITQGNRNRVKLRFLNFVLSHMTSLFTVTRNVYLRKDESGEDWVVVTPKSVIKDDMTPEQIAEAVQEWEKAIEKNVKEHPNVYRKADAREGIPYKMPNKENLSEHQVYVKRAGKTFVITVNGSPRVAQALNGLTNPDAGTGLKLIDEGANFINKANRFLSTVYTTRNINFVASNFMRDMVYTNSMVWLKESPEYARKFNVNVGKVLAEIFQLFHKLENGTLDMNDPEEKLFTEFIKNGGETGYTQVKDIEAKKKELKKALEKAERSGLDFKDAPWGKTKDGAEALTYYLDFVNRSIENVARFAAYKTSREMGRSVPKSIWDAKEISVNFNKKGAGGKFYKTNGQTWLGSLASAVSGTGRGTYVFWNASVQGIYNFASAAKENPEKAAGMATSLLLLGFLMPIFSDLVSGDDEEYMILPEYIRRNNICINVFGDHWVTIPLPIEYRALYGAGEYLSNILSGREELDALKMAELFSQLLPVDVLEGGGGLNAFVPTIAKPWWEAYHTNKSWTGLPIWKDSPFDKEYVPQHKRVYKNASPALVGFSKMLNQLGGGDDVEKGIDILDINPAKLEHVLEGYFGGFVTMGRQIINLGSAIFDEDYDFDPKDLPVLSRAWKYADRERASSGIKSEFYDIKKNYDEVKGKLRDYSKMYMNPNVGDEERSYALERINKIYNSDAYKASMVYDAYRRSIEGLMKQQKENDTPEVRKAITDLMKTVNSNVKEALE